MRFYPPGTHARVIGGREALAALDAAALVEIRRFVNTGFDAMADQVDPFLDGYYSLWSEYWRIGVAVTGMLQGNAEAAMEEHLANRLTAALDRETHLHAINERLAAMGVPAAYGAQEAQEMAMDGMEVIGLNPARIRLVGIFPDFPPLPELRSSGLTSTIEARLSGSVAVGALSTLVARRVVERLLQRGVLRVGARAVMAMIPLAGTALAFGTDGVALKLEEHFDRDFLINETGFHLMGEIMGETVCRALVVPVTTENALLDGLSAYRRFLIHDESRGAHVHGLLNYNPAGVATQT